MRRGTGCREVWGVRETALRRRGGMTQAHTTSQLILGSRDCGVGLGKGPGELAVRQVGRGMEKGERGVTGWWP